jgi:predicted  nucleic acid-binding Zn-ribbon protein
MSDPKNPAQTLVKISVWDLETDEIIEMEIAQECIDAMDKATEEAEKLHEEALRKDGEAWQYVRD